jgi:hypothetical protein
MARTDRFAWTLLAALAVAMPAPATVYYLDASAGSDSNGGTVAQPWKTFSRLRQARLAPGDYVLLKRGEVWREQLVVSSSGSEGARITYGAYGTGPAPAIDGQGLTLPEQSGLVSAGGRSFLAFDGIEVRNSPRDGFNLYAGVQLAIRNSAVHHSRSNGILVYDGSYVSIENCEIYSNSLDTNESYAGIRLDGGGPAQTNLLLANNRIYGHIGGDDWLSGNGIVLGHTGPNTPNMQSVLIAGNEIHHNGNPKQNQAGRGITAHIQGDVAVVRNYIYRNASAGIYLGDHGLALRIEIEQNVFVNNALRQFGGFTDAGAVARHNLAFVDDPALTAMGAEVGGRGGWTLENNVFAYTTSTRDIYRGFIRINDSAQEDVLQSDHNVFYSAGPQRWIRSDSIPLPFDQWQSPQRDRHSVSLR